jgi:hypothetical protein
VLLHGHRGPERRVLLCAQPNDGCTSEDFACQKLAESLIHDRDVHPTVAAALGQILEQHELAAWHDWARELALAPSWESLTALAAIMA